MQTYKILLRSLGRVAGGMRRAIKLAISISERV